MGETRGWSRGLQYECPLFSLAFLFIKQHPLKKGGDNIHVICWINAPGPQDAIVANESV